MILNVARLKCRLVSLSFMLLWLKMLSDKDVYYLSEKEFTDYSSKTRDKIFYRRFFSEYVFHSGSLIRYNGYLFRVGKTIAIFSPKNP